MTDSMKIAIFGAGSIGVYVGAALLAAGANVSLIGRASMAAQLAQYGVHLSDLAGNQTHIQAADLPFFTDPAQLSQADLILVCVKSAASATAAATLAQYAKDDALIISLQNGVGNATILQAQLGKRVVLAGMVPFNVVQNQRGGFHRGTEGELCIANHAAITRWLPLFAKAGLPLQTSDNFAAVQWGKLLLNLNNAVNALSNLPLRSQLMQRPYRLVLAALIAEGLQVLAAAGIRPAQVARAKPQWLPTLLRLPDFLFCMVASSMLRIDAAARSSMWEDLQARRLTEVDFLNGAIVALAQQHGLQAPANACLQQLIHAAEQGPLPAWPGAQLWQTVRAAVA